MKILVRLLTTVYVFCSVYVKGEEASDDPLSLCNLVEEDVSLAALDKEDYFVTTNDEGENMYLAVCHQLKNLPEQATSLCDSDAYSCITKRNETGHEIEYLRNAGSQTSGLTKDGLRISVEYSEGSQCVGRFKQSLGYKTRIDFFCNSDFSTDNSIRYEGLIGKCTSQVFWFSSLVCLPEDLIEYKDTGSCVINVPGYDTTLDLSGWAKKDGEYFTAAGPKRYFQLNLCDSVKGGTCTNGSAVCEVDATGVNLVNNLVGENPKRILTYDEIKEVITLKYVDDQSKKVMINIKCDNSAMEPVLTFLSQEGSSYTFLFLTRKACFVPVVQCIAEDSSGNIYRLSSLSSQEWDVGVADTDVIYAVKVCGSLPMSSEIPCKSQTGICTYKNNGNDKKEALSLGVMYEHPQVNEDQSITLTYANGDNFTDPTTNQTCLMSALITLICDHEEEGPRLDSKTKCQHNLVWKTPAACPVKKVVSHDCTVREPLYSHLFNLTDLHNDTQDYHLSLPSDNNTFVLNVCGPTLSCSDGDICLEHETDLIYQEGSLVMRHSSNTICPSYPNRNISASIIFLCHHDLLVGTSQHSLSVTPTDDECHYDLTWYTALACPPHEVVQCSVVGSKGVVDLSSLSLPHHNYHVGDFSINICRSLVHEKGSHCPYHSAACLTNVGTNGQIDSNNLGEVTDRLQIDPEGNVFITYKLGSICMEPNTNKGHIDTKIYFTCEEGTYDTVPVFVKNTDCSYIFSWTHAAACPVQRKMEGNCTVTNPVSGFTYNLTNLQYHDQSSYHWKGSYHHIKGDYQLNICGPLLESKCSVGSGVCTVDGHDLGLANANLRIEDGQLSLNYVGGAPCENGEKMSTLINFVCPQRRKQLTSGNFEKDGPKLVRRDSKCVSAVQFYTDLACEHQVHCEVDMEVGVKYSLTKLRRHQNNYHVVNKNTGKSEFFLNICGSLVQADVPSSECISNGACLMTGRGDVGLGQVQTSPYMGDNGHLVIDYLDGGLCGNRGQRWSTRIIFTCERSEEDDEHPFGYPFHISTDDCRNTFHFPTVLACNDTTAVKNISEPDSCQIFHDGISRYIDFSTLIKNTSYKIQNEIMKNSGEYFEIQPCGKTADSCNGAICKVTPHRNLSLGLLNDFQYDPNQESVKFRYIEGSDCDTTSGMKWKSKIYYICDPTKGIGSPVITSTNNCQVIFEWRTEVFCRKEHGIPSISLVDDKNKDDPQMSPVVGGSSWGNLFIVLTFFILIGGIVVLYRKPQARERVFRMLQESRARLPVVLGGRRRDDSTLLVTNSNMSSDFGSLADDEDFS